MKFIIRLNYKKTFFLFAILIFSALSCTFHRGVQKIDGKTQIDFKQNFLKIDDIKSITFILKESPIPMYSKFFADALSIVFLEKKIPVISYEMANVLINNWEIKPDDLFKKENLIQISSNLNISHVGKISYSEEEVLLEIFSTDSGESIFMLKLTGPNKVKEGHLVFGNIFKEFTITPQKKEPVNKESKMLM